MTDSAVPQLILLDPRELVAGWRIRSADGDLQGLADTIR